MPYNKHACIEPHNTEHKRKVKYAARHYNNRQWNKMIQGVQTRMQFHFFNTTDHLACMHAYLVAHIATSVKLYGNTGCIMEHVRGALHGSGLLQKRTCRQYRGCIQCTTDYELERSVVKHDLVHILATISNGVYVLLVALCSHRWRPIISYNYTNI